MNSFAAAILISGFILATTVARSREQPYYVIRCSHDDPDLNECLRQSGNRLAMFLRRGVPELGINEVEPVLIDEIGIALGSGPDAYRATFRDIEAYGVGNLTLTNVKSNVETLQFQLTLEIPRIVVSARFRSSGILILVQASGAGDYWGEYEHVRAKVYFKAVPIGEDQDGFTYLRTEIVKMDFNVKDIRMGVENVENGNSVIQAALNLFINTNAQELLKEMKPALKMKLTQILRSFINRLFTKIPLEQWID